MNVLYVNDGTGLLRGSAGGVGARRAEPGEDRLRHRLVRLRQRRLARSARRQRRRRAHRGAGAREGSVSAADGQRSCIATSANGRFEDVSDRAGAVFKRADVGRGAAFGDIDNDGDIDVVVGNAAGPLQLLVNDVGQPAATGSGCGWSAPTAVATCSARAWQSCAQRADAVAPGAGRRQLCVGQRPARARRPRRDRRRRAARARAVAGRQTRGVRTECPLDRWTTLKRGDGEVGHARAVDCWWSAVLSA